MSGPGVMAATTATSSKGGAGDSHRGAVAAALVEVRTTSHLSSQTTASPTLVPVRSAGAVGVGGR